MTERGVRGRTILISMLVLIALCMLALPTAAADVMFQADSQHTGVYDNGGITPTGTEAWSLATGGVRMFSSPAVSDGVVFIGSYNNALFAINAQNGKTKWTFPTGDAVYSSPAVSNGVVYAGSFDNNLYAIDAATGAEKWRFDTGSKIVSSPTLSGGLVYLSSNNGNLYALDAATGKEKWRFVTGPPESTSLLSAPPAVSGGILYAATLNRTVYALDAATGREIWRYPQNWILEGAPSVSGGVVYLGIGPNLTALDAGTGAVKWRFETGSTIMSCPAISNGVVYVGSFDRNVYAVDALTGKEKWRFTTGYAIEASPAISGNIVYVGSLDGHLYALDAATGAEKWRFGAENSIYSSPSVSHGLVYFGSSDGYVYAVGAPQTTTPATNPFTGSWDMGGRDGVWGFGNCMMLHQSGSTVTGNYTHEQGMVTGLVSGTTFSGTWAEAPTYTGSTDSGRFVVTLSADGNTFSGTWGYGDASTTYSFTGTRSSNVCPITEPVQYFAITGITPSSAPNTGMVGITGISGSGFPEIVSVKLTRPGSQAITASGITVVSSSKITCNFDLAGKASGPWDVVVTKPDGQSVTLPNGFTITPQAASTLTVSSYPTGADLFIDGVQRGTTPTTFSDILPGSHSVTVAKIGYYGYYTQVSVTEGQPTTVDVTLQPLETGTGIISVRSTPTGATIALDGKNTGKTTPAMLYEITPGKHTVDVTMVEYGTYTKTITVASGTTVEVIAPWSYTEKDAVVFFGSTPDGANVFISDVMKGVTPFTLHLKKGTYIVTMTKEGYADDISSITVGSGDVTEVKRTLESNRPPWPLPGFEGILALVSLIAVVVFTRKFR